MLLLIINKSNISKFNLIYKFMSCFAILQWTCQKSNFNDIHGIIMIKRLQQLKLKKADQNLKKNKAFYQVRH